MKQNYSNVRAIIITRRILNRYLDLYILRKIPCVGRNNYYCGITNDLKRRFEEHHLTLDHLVCFYNCPTVEIAKKWSSYWKIKVSMSAIRLQMVEQKTLRLYI